jgi:ABC-2 type transport system permease protein
MIYRTLWLEWFKLRKRLATWGVYIAFLTLTIFLFGVPFYAARGHRGAYWGLPQAWPTILSGGAPMASIFGAVLVALTVSAEFEWRTTRQNLMDGLSRGDWLFGKVLLLPAITVALYGTQLALGTTLALLDTHAAHRAVLYPASTYLSAGLGVGLGMCCYAAIALLISICVRSSGPAIGLTVIYQVFDNIVARTLRGFHLDALAAWLPFQVHNSLLQFDQYLPRPSPSLDYHWSTAGLILAGTGWAVALVLASRRVYLRRDL